MWERSLQYYCVKVGTLFNYVVNILEEAKWKGESRKSHNDGFTFYCIYHEFQVAGIFFMW